MPASGPGLASGWSGGGSAANASISAEDADSFAADEVPGVVKKLIETYVSARTPEERFLDTVRRLGVAPFKARVYGESSKKAEVTHG